MPDRDYAFWLALFASVLLLAIFSLSGLISGFTPSAWHLAITFNILAPLALWWMSTELLRGRESVKNAHAAKLKTSLKIPGLNTKVQIKEVSLILGLFVLVPSAFWFARYYSSSAYVGSSFFYGLYSVMIVLWGVSLPAIFFHYLRSRKCHTSHVAYHIYAPVLGVLVGLVASVHVLLVMVFRYLGSKGAVQWAALSGEAAGGLMHAFSVFLRLAGSNGISPMAIELIFGLFLVETTVIASSFVSRNSYGKNPAAESQAIAKNLFVAVLCYTAVFFIIPGLFSPIIWGLGLM
ncbi:MAG: hypothetical protein ACP5E4_01040 [Candidatus Aenigmatarchaeota archaeon]